MNLARRWFPAQPHVPVAEKFLAGLTAFASIWLLWNFSEIYPSPLGTGILASMGATAVLLFAAPHSTLVQPSAIMGGHILSALVGVAAHRLAPSPDIAAASAVGISILLMHLLHCLHPPGGATALFAVVGGEPVWNLGYAYALTPVALNAFLMLLLGLLINNLRRPRQVYPAPASDPAKPVAATGFPGTTREDIARTLRESGTYLDITENDLLEIVQVAELAAAGRFLGSHRAKHLIREDVETLRYGDSLNAVWKALERSTQGCVVVVDAFNHVEGIITFADVTKMLGRHNHQTPWATVRKLLRSGGTRNADERGRGPDHDPSCCERRGKQFTR